MAGPIKLNPDMIKNVGRIARFDAEREAWVAGPDAPGEYESGDVVPTKEVKQGGRVVEVPKGDVGRSYQLRRYYNNVKGVIHRSEMENVDAFDDELTEEEARELVSELRDRLEGADREEVREIRKELLGYE